MKASPVRNETMARVKNIVNLLGDKTNVINEKNANMRNTAPTPKQAKALM